jgi:hypothetical protein
MGQITPTYLVFIVLVWVHVAGSQQNSNEFRYIVGFHVKTSDKPAVCDRNFEIRQSTYSFLLTKVYLVPLYIHFIFSGQLLSVHFRSHLRSFDQFKADEVKVLNGTNNTYLLSFHSISLGTCSWFPAEFERV